MQVSDQQNVISDTLQNAENPDHTHVEICNNNNTTSQVDASVGDVNKNSEICITVVPIEIVSEPMQTTSDANERKNKNNNGK